MGCNRVDVIIRCTAYNAFFVKCPVCGRWGRPHRKARNTYGVGHYVGGHGTYGGRNERCSTTQYPKFQRFIEEVQHTVYQMQPSIIRKHIRKGRLPIEVPTINSKSYIPCTQCPHYVQPRTVECNIVQ